MSKSYVHRPTFGPFRGIDTSVDKLNLPAGHNSSALNVVLPRGTTAVETRPGVSRTGGYETIGATRGWGLFPYLDTDVTTGAQTERLLTFDIESGTPYELVKRTFTMTQAASNHTVSVFVEPVSRRRYFQVYYTVTNAVRFLMALDDVDHVPNVTISHLITAINANTNMINLGVSAALGTAVGTEMAADVLPVIRDLLVESVGTSITGRIWQAVPYAAGINGLIVNHKATLSSTNAEMPSYANINGCLYIAFGGEVPLLKWDGGVVRVAGMAPAGTTSGAVFNGATGTIANGTYTYLVTFEQSDAKGNRIEGLAFSKPNVDDTDPDNLILNPYKITVASGTGDNAVNIDPITVAGYSTGGGYTNTQTLIDNTTSEHSATVSSGHTLQVGDMATFYVTRDITVDGNVYTSVLLCTAPVIATSSTSLTFGGVWDIMHTQPGYSVADNATPVARLTEEFGIDAQRICGPAGTDGAVFKHNTPISAGLRAYIWRNKGAGLVTGDVTDWSSAYYLVDVIPHPFGGTKVYHDDKYNDDDLGPALTQKIDFSGSSWPASYQYSVPMGRYVAATRDRLYCAGIAKNPDVVDRSDILFGPEWFDPRGLSQLSMSFGQGDRVSGLRGGDDYMFVGKSGSVVVIDGDLASDSNVRVTVLSSEINCLAHASMKNVMGGVIFCSRLGPFVYLPGKGLDFLGKSDVTGKSKLDGVFARASGIDSQRICAEIDPARGLYIMYVPDAVDGTQDGDPNLLHGFQAYSTPTGIDQTGAIYVYDVLNKAWLKWTGIDPSGGITFFDGNIYYSRVGYDRASGDYASRTFVTNSSGTQYDMVDWYSAIEVEVGTPWDTLGEPFHKKQYQRAAILNVEGTISAQSLFITTYANYDDATISSRGPVNFFTGQTRRPGIKLRTLNVVALRAVVSANSINQRTQFNGIELEASAQFRPKLGVPAP